MDELRKLNEDELLDISDEDDTQKSKYMTLNPETNISDWEFSMSMKLFRFPQLRLFPEQKIILRD